VIFFSVFLTATSFVLSLYRICFNRNKNYFI